MFKFLIALITFFSLSINFDFMFIGKILILFLLFIMFFKFSKISLKTHDIFIFFFLGLYMSVNVLYAILSDIPLNLIFNTIQFYLIFLIFLLCGNKLLSYINLSKVNFAKFILLAIVSSSILHSIFDVISGREIFEFDRGLPRLRGSLGVAPSSIMYYLCTLISMFIYFETKDKRYIFFTAFFIILVIGSLTRITIFALAISLIYFFHSYKIKNKLIINISLLLPTLFILGFSIFERLFQNNQSISIENINYNGRLYLWEYLWSNINNFYIGNGYGSSVFALINLGENLTGIQPHNDFLRILFDTGFLGLFVNFLMFGYLWRLIGKSKNTYNLFLKSLCIGFPIFMATDVIYIYSFFLFPVFLLIYNHKRLA